MVPNSPTSQSAVPTREMPVRSFIPMLVGDQLTPPSVVFRRMPPSPATHPTEASARRTALRMTPVPDETSDQETPPSDVRNTTPSDPAIHPVEALPNEMDV